jgi:hypothetical protein
MPSAVLTAAVMVSEGVRSPEKVEALQYMDRIEFIPVRPLKAMRGFLKGIDTSVARDRDRLARA